jgi:hypothetical protein
MGSRTLGAVALCLLLSKVALSQPPSTAGSNPFAVLPVANDVPQHEKTQSTPFTKGHIANAKQRLRMLGGSPPPNGWEKFVQDLLEISFTSGTSISQELEISALPWPAPELFELPSEFVSEVLRRVEDSALKEFARSWKALRPGDTPPVPLAAEVRSRAKKNIERAKIWRNDRRSIGFYGAISGAGFGIGLPLLTQGTITLLEAAYSTPRTMIPPALLLPYAGLCGGIGALCGMAMRTVQKGDNASHYLREAESWRLLSHPGSKRANDCAYSALGSPE